MREILDAAQRIVATEGLEALTLGHLARHLDLVPTALYRYFDSKDALLAALGGDTVSALRKRFDERRAAVRERAQALHLDEGAAALSELLAAAEEYLALPRVAPERFRLVSLLLADPRPLVADAEAQAHVPAIAAFLDDIRALFVRAERGGALSAGDPMDRTAVLWAALQGTAQLGKLGRFDARRFDAERLGIVTVDSLLLDFGTSPRCLERARAAVSFKLKGARAPQRKKKK